MIALLLCLLYSPANILISALYTPHTILLILYLVTPSSILKPREKYDSPWLWHTHTHSIPFHLPSLCYSNLRVGVTAACECVCVCVCVCVCALGRHPQLEASKPTRSLGGCWLAEHDAEMQSVSAVTPESPICRYAGCVLATHVWLCLCVCVCVCDAVVYF